MKKNYFLTPYNEFVYLRTYARWIEQKGRRENWSETVQRYMDFMRENLGTKLTEKEYSEVHSTILKQEAMPSMRLLQFAGEAARRTNVCAYNCSYIAPTSTKCLSEIVYILMCGTGVGFSVEKETVNKFPTIKKQTGEVKDFVIDDSKEGWADAFYVGLDAWFSGEDINFDYSELRPAGARLKTFGGFSSGPEPLRDLMNFSRKIILANQGNKLSPINVHDIICKIAEIVVCGGVRRSALISLSELNDEDMRVAKQGEFWIDNVQRGLANNSAIYEEKPSAEEFKKEWDALVASNSGERGIFNKGALLKQLPERRIKYFEEKGIVKKGEWTGKVSIGTNPCAEIILQSKQFCNLSEAIARPEDSKEDLLRKIKVASILGTYQSTLVNLGYLSKKWVKNSEEERLLGVSISGQLDSEVCQKPETLGILRDEAIKVNKEYAERFEIPQSTCVTAVKPSGNLSQTFGCSSGLHPRFAKHYIRRVRITYNDPLLKLCRDAGVPAFPEVGQEHLGEDATTWVLEFVVKSPDGAKIKKDMTALDQLEYWKRVKVNYTEHNPSVTIYVKTEEWETVREWVYGNWDYVGGLSFLPASDHVYRLAPYEEIDEQEYDRRSKELANLDLSKLLEYETEDTTENKRELACVAGQCEL